jgi:hypothetical protein
MSRVSVEWKWTPAGYEYKWCGGAIATAKRDIEHDCWKLSVEEGIRSNNNLFPALEKHQYQSEGALEWAALLIAQELCDTGH